MCLLEYVENIRLSGPWHTFDTNEMVLGALLALLVHYISW